MASATLALQVEPSKYGCVIDESKMAIAKRTLGSTEYDGSSFGHAPSDNIEKTAYAGAEIEKPPDE